MSSWQPCLCIFRALLLLTHWLHVAAIASCIEDPYTVPTRDGEVILIKKPDQFRGADFIMHYYKYELLPSVCAVYPEEGPDLNAKPGAGHTCSYYMDAYYTHPDISSRCKPRYSQAANGDSMKAWTKEFALSNGFPMPNLMHTPEDWRLQYNANQVNCKEDDNIARQRSICMMTFDWYERETRYCKSNPSVDILKNPSPKPQNVWCQMCIPVEAQFTCAAGQTINKFMQTVDYKVKYNVRSSDCNDCAPGTWLTCYESNLSPDTPCTYHVPRDIDLHLNMQYTGYIDGVYTDVVLPAIDTNFKLLPFNANLNIGKINRIFRESTAGASYAAWITMVRKLDKITVLPDYAPPFNGYCYPCNESIGFPHYGRTLDIKSEINANGQIRKMSHYCPGGAAAPRACSLVAKNMVSLVDPNTGYTGNCVCDDTFYFDSSAAQCELCPASYMCTADLNALGPNNKRRCDVGTYSQEGMSSCLQCTTDMCTDPSEARVECKQVARSTKPSGETNFQTTDAGCESCAKCVDFEYVGEDAVPCHDVASLV